MERDIGLNWTEHRHTPPSELTSNAMFSELIPEILASKRFSIDPSISSIDLGEIYHLMKIIREFTLRDNDRSEFQIRFFMDKNNRLKFFPLLNKGGKTSVNSGFYLGSDVMRFDSSASYFKRTAGSLHTHPPEYSSIPSFSDLARILVGPGKGFNTDAFEAVVGEKSSVFVFRGLNTPFLTVGQSLEFRSYMKRMSSQKHFFGTADIYDELYKRMALDFDLQFFSSDIENPILTKTSVDKIQQKEGLTRFPLDID